MKHVIPALLLLSLFSSSSIAQERYYAPGYPSPHSETYHYGEHWYKHYHPHYPRVPQARVYQRHANNHGTVHGNVSENTRLGGAAAIKQPRQAQIQHNVHENEGTNGPVVKYPTESRPKIIVQPNR
ncbi:hypothetical protein [Legionella sp.]|uniref:hypothetical protein n=1 Tax=Legionella sp. TaxID=459 RepID=UPI003C826536